MYLTGTVHVYPGEKSLSFWRLWPFNTQTKQGNRTKCPALSGMHAVDIDRESTRIRKFIIYADSAWITKSDCVRLLNSGHRLVKRHLRSTLIWLGTIPSLILKNKVVARGKTQRVSSSLTSEARRPRWNMLLEGVKDSGVSYSHNRNHWRFALIVGNNALFRSSSMTLSTSRVRNQTIVSSRSSESK